MNITDRFIHSLETFVAQDIAPETVHQVKRCLLDYFGVAFAGCSEARNRLDDLIQVGSSGECRIIGSGQQTDIYTAVCINGFYSHLIELDDGHRMAMLHLETAVITSMLAIAQKESLSLSQFINGIVVGYEATIRLASAIQPDLKKKGFHASGVCASVGVACGIAFALGYHQDQIKTTISAAATSAAGLLEVIDDASELKPYNIAQANMNAIQAVYFGRCGFRAPKDILGGKRGFLQGFGKEINEDMLFGNGQSTPAIMQIYLKPYAACRHCHAPIECALNLYNTYSIDCDDIADIEVQTYKLAIFGHDRQNVYETSSAKMSTPFCVASALITGSCSIDAFSPEMVADESIQKLASKVRVIENTELTAASPQKRGAIVQVRLSDGTVFSKKVLYPLGEPENPITDEVLLEKYYSLMHHAGLVDAEAETIRKTVWNLEEQYLQLLKI